MCKFKGLDDPNYRKFGAEMGKLYNRSLQSKGDARPPASSITHGALK
jgi:hypothetical protein